MKRTLTFFALAIGIVATAVSCDKGPKTEIQEPLKLVIRANSPETRTSITDNGNGSYSPSWSAGDAIGVYFTNVDGDATEFVNSSAGTTALFEPGEEITSVSGDQTLYAFYPLSAFKETTSGKNIRVTVKDAQTPNGVGTFDKDADLLVARPFEGNITTINADGGIIDLAFARILSVVKVTPTDGTTGNELAGEYVKTIKIEYNGSGSDHPLTGRVTLDLDSGELGDWTVKTYSVSASYGDGMFELDGTNAAFLLANPATIATGKRVTFTVKTDKHDAYKSFDLSSNLVFPAGNIATIGLTIDDTWTIEDNTLDPNIIFKAPFTADINSNTTYDQATHGDLGVVGTSKSTITYSFAGSQQLRNNTNKISADDASFYWCTSSTGLTIGGINTGSNQYFNLSFDRKVPSSTATLAITISEDGTHFFPITSAATVSLESTTVTKESFNFSIPSGEHTSLRLKFENSGSGVSIDNVILTRLEVAGDENKAVSFNVVAVDPVLEVSPSPVNIVEGNTQQLTVTGTNGTISYVSNDPNVATVNSTGLITAVAEGTTTIGISSSATADYNAGATSVTVNVTAVPTPESLPYSNSLTNGHSGFVINNVSTGSLGTIWSDTQYGIQANAFQTTSNVEAYLESPLINLSTVEHAKLSFTHGINFFASVETAKSQATLEVRVQDGAWSQVVIPDYPESLGNGTVDTEINLDSYAGNVIQFRFKYLATSSNPGRWQIKNLSVSEVVFETSFSWNSKNFEVEVGESKSNNVTVNSGASISYNSNDTDIATVAADGTVTGVAEGSTTINVHVAANGNYPAKDSTFNVTVTPAVADYVTLDWDYAGGTAADLNAVTGVTTSGLGSDYAESHAPNRVKFDGNGDYIQVKTDVAIGTVSVGYKMIGGASTSYLNIFESTDGSSWGDRIDRLEISGAQNSIGTVTTTAIFNDESRYVKIVFEKGANVGIGAISIHKPSTDPVIAASDINNVPAVGVTDASASYEAHNFSDDVEVSDFTGCVSAATADAGVISYSVTPNYTTTANSGTIVLCSASDPSVTKTINVNQLKSTLSVSSLEVIIPADASTATFTVTTTEFGYNAVVASTETDMNLSISDGASGAANASPQTVTVSSTTAAPASGEPITLGTISVYRNGNTSDTQKKTITIKKAVAGSGSGSASVLYTADFEGDSEHRTSGTNSYTSNTYTVSGVEWSLEKGDIVTSGSPLHGSANIMCRIAKNTTNTAIVTTENLISTNKSITKVTFLSSLGTNVSLSLQYSTNGGTTWNDATITKDVNVDSTNGYSATLSNVTTEDFRLKFSWSVASSTNSNRDSKLDDIIVYGL